jgi:hypothetical protein
MDSREIGGSAVTLSPAFVSARFRSLLSLAETEMVVDPSGPTCRVLCRVLVEMAADNDGVGDIVAEVLCEPLVAERFDLLAAASREIHGA